MKNIIKYAIVIFSDGSKEDFDAVRITGKGVSIGKIIDCEFESYGFIPKQSIKQIINGKGRKINAY